MIAEGAFYHLDAPVRRLGALDVPCRSRRRSRTRPCPLPSWSRRRRARALRKEEVDAMGIRSYGDDGRRLGAAGRLRPAAHASGSHARSEFSSESELGALLCFDMSNIRYITATHIGMWAVDKLIRFCLLTRDDEPIMWDFGSAARHHKLYSPWLGRRALARRHLDAARLRQGARRVGRREDPRRARAARPAGTSRSASTSIELPVLFALQKAGITVVDGQALMQDVRKIKTAGRDHAAEHGLRDGRRGVRRAVHGDEAGLPRERLRRARQQGAVRARLGARRGRQRDLRRALRAASARLHRPDAAPGRPRVLRHPPRVQRLPHVLLPHVRGRLARRARSSTRTSAAATSSTTRSR